MRRYTFTKLDIINCFYVVPSAPLNFQGEFINDKSIILYWGPPSTPNGYILGYFFYIEWQNNNTTNIQVGLY